ncbi:hypothetical protein TNCV_1498161 [Trichonephila clavipes]|nr:hypothetical protein TNCV_1498161 [Trichonephila clavipes]
MLLDPSGHSSPVVKVTDSWQVCHEFEPSTIEDPQCNRGRFTLNKSRFKRPPFDVVCKLGDGGASSQGSSSSLDHGSKFRGPSPKALE